MNIRQLIYGMALSVVLQFVMGSSSRLQAQAPLDPPATRKGMELRGPGSQGPAFPSAVMSSSRTFYLQGIVVVALFGGAIWAVSHSSRRV